jgi:hypothetical protein
MAIAKTPVSTLKTIHGGTSSTAGLGAKFDPLLNSTMLLTWHRLKTAMADLRMPGVVVTQAHLHRELAEMVRDLVITIHVATSGSFSLEAIASLPEEEQPPKRDGSRLRKCRPFGC